ncbi:protein of unknown function [Pararobbsia alpina]
MARTDQNGRVRLAVFISVSTSKTRTPMNGPLRSGRACARLREAGFDEGCGLFDSYLKPEGARYGNRQESSSKEGTG